jgi:hypothetical protein
VGGSLDKSEIGHGWSAPSCNCAAATRR